MSLKRKRDLLEVLGLPSDAGDEDIRRAYKKLAFVLHPDRNQGDKEKEIAFQKLNEGGIIFLKNFEFN